jgi:hypothetical protein
MYELVVRINGTHAAFTALGRNRTRQPRICSSVSLFLFREGRRIHHTLLDIGPGVCEAIQADDLYPRPFPLDWLVLSHSHSDHFLDLDGLCGDLYWWYRTQNREYEPLKICCLPSTFQETVQMVFPFQTKTIAHTPAEAGRAFPLWQEGSAKLEATLVEVAHFRQSTVSVFTFDDGQSSPPVRVVCLFDFGDFYPPNSPQARAGGHADNPLFHQPDLLIAESTHWTDPRQTIGKASAHVAFEQLAGYLLRWRAVQTRIVHYAGFEDMYGEGGPEAYQERLQAGLRIHPRQGPTSNWELSHAMQTHLAHLGYTHPHSVVASYPGETLVVYPRV